MRIGGFREDDGGSVAIISAMTLLTVVLATGGGIDYERWRNARQTVMSALDSAVIAGARSIASGGAETEAVAIAEDVLSSNLGDQFNFESNTIAFGLSDDGAVFSGEGNAALSTIFLKLIGIDSLPMMSDPAAMFPAAQISGEGRILEIAMMLDATGSMCDDGVGQCASGVKLDALKSAANELISTVLGTAVTDPPSPHRIALAPFSHRIRVAPDGQGSALMTTLTDLSPTWSGWHTGCVGTWTLQTSSTTVEGIDTSEWVCDLEGVIYEGDLKIRPGVTDRWTYKHDGYTVDEFDLTDDPPGPNKWLMGAGGSRFPLSWNSSDLDTPTSNLGESESDPAKKERAHHNYQQNGADDIPESNEIMPLNSDPVALKARVDGLNAVGSTAGGLGTAFAWYMLSPKWADVWPAGSAPGPYPSATVENPPRKVAILMTDGVYNTTWGWPSIEIETASAHAIALCDNMKTAGIEIYTVGFALDGIPAYEQSLATATLQACGSSIEHFYNTFSVSELIAAFQNIGTTITAAPVVRLIR